MLQRRLLNTRGTARLRQAVSSWASTPATLHGIYSYRLPQTQCFHSTPADCRLPIFGGHAGRVAAYQQLKDGMYWFRKTWPGPICMPLVRSTSKKCIRLCQKHGFSPKQVKALNDSIYHRHISFCSPKQIHEWLDNLDVYLEDPSSIPTQLRAVYEDYSEHDSQSYFGGATGPVQWEQLQNHSSDAFGAALSLIANDKLEAIDAALEYSMPMYNMVCFILEIAMHFHDVSAAETYLHMLADPEIARAVAEGDVGDSTQLATQVLETAIFDLGWRHWQAIVVYMAEEYRPTNIGKHSPADFVQALDLLQGAAERISPGQETSRTMKYPYDNPWRLMLRILDHCLNTLVSLPNHSQDEIVAWRMKCLRKLTEHNDPNACFEIALKEEEYGSASWRRLITCAATTTEPNACWLLAMYHWEKDGLLDIVETGEAREEAAKNSQGFDWARLAIFCQPKQPVLLFNRLYPTVALLRLHHLEEAAGDFLSDVSDHVRKLSWFPRKQLTHIEELDTAYFAKSGHEALKKHKYWTFDLDQSEIEKRLSAKEAIKIAWRQLPVLRA